MRRGVVAGKTISISVLRREDLLPHRPQITFPAAPKPKPVPPEHTVFADFSKMPWTDVPGIGGMKAVFGESMSIFMWRITAET